MNRFNGLHFAQEYLCLGQEDLQQPLHVYLIFEDIVIADISRAHSFVGYSPVIFAISDRITGGLQPGEIRIAFTAAPLDLNVVFRSKDAIAVLFLSKIRSQSAGTGEAVIFYAANKGTHHFISRFSRLILDINNRLYQKKPGNVYLPGNAYRQVQIAYAVPRNISLVTTGRAGLFNLFPTDLHGQAGGEHYIISLRHEGRACKQVMETGKILLTAMDSGSYKKVYSLGKNHMQEMKEKSNFPFSDRLSPVLQLPLPGSGVAYRELELADSFMHGIHRLFLFKTLTRQNLEDNPSTLAHVHQVYASWRQNNGLTGNYLFR